ncbi:MAG: hypothetical protein AAFY56_14355 [Pseudomonadota bacterium]
MGDLHGAGYTAIGNPVILASRLCDQAEDGQILIDQRAYIDVEDKITAQSIGTQQLKGITKNVEAYSVET